MLLGGGTFAWLGFGIIGLVLMRRSWLVAAAVYAVLAFMVSVLSFSALGSLLQIPLIIVTTIHALVANRTWLATIWGRRERGERMLGRGGAAVQNAVPHVPPAGVRPAPPAAVTPSLLAAEAEERARVAAQAAAQAVPAVPVAPVAPAVPVVPVEPSAAPVEVPVPTAPSVDQPYRTELPTFAPTPVSDPLRSTAPTSTPSSAGTPLRVDPIATVLGASVLGGSALTASAITSLPKTVLTASSVVLPPREALNPMTAPPELLAAIPVIGPAGAAQIVAAREHHVLDSVQAVADAVGLQGFELVRIRPFLRFD